MTKIDAELKRDIDAELAWDPKVNAAQIGVSVVEGAVSLSGTVDTYAEKRAAEAATTRVGGVRTVAQGLTVEILPEHERSDFDLARAVQSALHWNVRVPEGITATVHNGSIKLEGQVAWNFQREAAERALCYLTGVVGVVNSITIKHETPMALQEANVKVALAESQAVDQDEMMN